jgi:hypothetical protein
MNKELEEAAETIAKGFGSENWQEIKDGIIRYAIDDKQQEKLFSEEDMREALFHALYLPKKDGYIEKTIDEIVRETMSIFKNK